MRIVLRRGLTSSNVDGSYGRFRRILRALPFAYGACTFGPRRVDFEQLGHGHRAAIHLARLLIYSIEHRLIGCLDGPRIVSTRFLGRQSAVPQRANPSERFREQLITD